MRHLLAVALIAMMVCLPCKLRAQDATEFEFVEKVEWTQCGDKACLTFEEAKKLAIMRAQYVALFRMIPVLEGESDAWKKASDSHKDAFQAMRRAHGYTDNIVQIQDQQLKKAIKQKNKAERFSVFGPAGTVAIALIAIAFAGGVAIGAK